MPRVFAIREDPRNSVDAAKDFGSLTYLLEGSTPSPFDTDSWIKFLDQAIDEKMFDCDEDFLILTGDHRIVAYTSCVFASRFEKFNVLVYDAKSSSYQRRVIDLKE